MRHLRNYFLFILFVLNSVFSFNGNECEESKCGRHGPAVRFPFGIRGRKPAYCRYPEVGFDLYCTDRKETVMELPNSVKLLVEKIDYVSQVIYTRDPENCFARQLSNFRLSASVFQFRYRSGISTTLLNCSIRSNNFPHMACLTAPNYQVYVLGSGFEIDRTMFLHCTKMNDLLSFPDDISYGNQILQLSWFRPDCGSCAALDKYCRLKDNTTLLETECYGKLPQPTWASAKFVATGTVLGTLLLVISMISLYRIYNFHRMEREYQSKIEKFLEDYKAFKPARYSYTDIKRMTNHFKEELGQGAYGTVFKGKLSDEIWVAVKVLNNSKGNGEEFVNEVSTIGKVHHVNVVRLIGFCADGFRRAVVYEYLSNDNLEKFISSADGWNRFLGWTRVQDIALGIAKGIEYLHQGCNQRILHFDIKPHNILLDNNFKPKISDFGLAKLCAKNQSAVSMTTARGTIGYIAPEVFSRNFGKVSYKSDVYSFGMVVLEMVGGRKSTTSDIKDEKEDQIYFPEWIYNLLDEGEDLRLVIEDEQDCKIARKLAIVGLQCIQWNPVDRPPMKQVVQMIEGDGNNLTKPPNPFSSLQLQRK